MFERLDQLEARYEELTNALASPEVTSDSAKYQKTAKAHSEVRRRRKSIRVQGPTRGYRQQAVLADEKDPDMLAYAKEELDKPGRVVRVEADLKVLLLPKDPNGEKT
jgi:peptide chain release factor 1